MDRLGYENKYGARYFLSQSPQSKSYKYGEDKGNNFYVAHQYKIGDKLQFSYASYEDVKTFIEHYDLVPDNELYFFEQIKESGKCFEYYDIEWEHTSHSQKLLEQDEEKTFREFLDMRNAYNKKYSIDDTHCRILSASSIEKNKGSLHIIISKSGYSFQNNHIYMKEFMRKFKRFINDHDENSILLSRIDWLVYSRNRNFRCIRSKKCSEKSRPFVKAKWHTESSQGNDIDFFVTNTLDDDNVIYVKIDEEVERSRRLKSYIYQKLSDNNVEVPCDIIHEIFNRSVYTDQYILADSNNKTIFRLQRIKKGYCAICKREHNSDNAYLTLSRSGTVYFNCYRADRNIKGTLIGDVNETNEHLSEETLNDTKELSSNTQNYTVRIEYDYKCEDQITLHSSAIYKLFMRKSIITVSLDDLIVEEQYSMFGVQNDNGDKKCMLLNSVGNKVLACIIPELYSEIQFIERSIKSKHDKTLYTFGRRPFLYITVYRICGQLNVIATRTETNNEIRATIKSFFSVAKPLKFLSHIATANYKPDVESLCRGKTYTVISYGEMKWHKTDHFFAILRCIETKKEFKIRAGKTLSNILKLHINDKEQFDIIIVSKGKDLQINCCDSMHSHTNSA